MFNKIAKINFKLRTSAEKAIDELFGKLLIKVLNTKIFLFTQKLIYFLKKLGQSFRTLLGRKIKQ